MRMLLHNPSVISALRPLKPLYARLFDRKRPDLPEDRPEARLRELDGKAIFLLSFGRSGTTVFCDFLSSHRAIASFGEVLNEDAFHSFFKTAAARRSGGSPSGSQIGFYRFLRDKVAKRGQGLSLFDMKIESLHTIEGNWRLPGLDFKLFDALLASRNPVILLERRDLVGRHLSHEVALRGRQFHSFQKGGADVEPFDIDIDAMDAEIRLIEAQFAFIRRKFRDYPHFYALAYEDLFEPVAEGGSRFSSRIAGDIARLLGVDDGFDAVPRIQKLEGKKGPHPVRNFAAVQDYRQNIGRARENDTTLV